MARKHHPFVEFEGVRFYTKPSGYFVAGPGKRVLGERYLHRAVWVRQNGPIPTDCAVHHTDHDKANNDIENLQCITLGEHARHHVKKRLREREPALLQGLVAAREAAKLWHGSPEGRAWHSQHAIRVAEKQRGFRVEHTCTWCGGTYLANAGSVKRGFCSMSCQGAARVASGVDDIERACVVCGSVFMANKYKKRKTCSTPCKHKAIALSHTGKRTPPTAPQRTGCTGSSPTPGAKKYLHSSSRYGYASG